jgi:hypothetical protein
VTSPVSPVPPSPEPSEKPTLPRELILFFVQFSVALNKSRAYPAGHPVLSAAIDVLVQNLNALFQRRTMLTIGVSRGLLFVDGVSSDEEHPVLKDLSVRLHRHQLAAVQLRPGLTGEEFGELLQALAAETWRQGKPLGLESLDWLLGQWPHVALEPIPLDQLELGQGSHSPSERQAEKLWQGLAHAALLTAQEGSGVPQSEAGTEDGEGGGGGGGSGSGGAGPLKGPVTSGTEVAQAIRKHRRDRAYNRHVLDWVMQVNDKMGDVVPGSTVHHAVADLFTGLEKSGLKNLLEMGTTPEERTALLKRGARNLPVRTVLDLVEAAASLSERSMSHSLLRLLGKLADHVDTARGPIVIGAEDVLRDSVRQLVGEWDEADPSAHSHRDLLELLSRPTSRSRGGMSGKSEAGSLRVLQMALELGVNTQESQAALADVQRESGLAGMLDLIERGTFASLDVDVVWQTLSDQKFLGERLLDETQDVTQVERVLAHLGPEGVNPLLEALEHAETASRRRWLLRRLEEFGPILGPRIAARLPGKPWFVQRNLLGLLATLPSLPGNFHPDAYTSHEDGRVRREAYKLLFANPEWRPMAIVRAAGDLDMGIVRLALSAALEQFPQDLAPKLLDHLSQRYKDQDIRLLAIRLLGKRPTTGGREWLTSRVASKRGWGPFRRLRLEPKSPEVLNALVVLAQQFGQHPEVAEIIRLASAGRDAEMRAASRGVAPRGM